MTKASIQDGRVELEGREHRHLSRVARVKSDDRVQHFDEDGMAYFVEVEDAQSGITRLRILEREAPVRPGLRVVLAQAVLKPKSMEMLIQKAMEVGPAAIVPLTALRSVARVGEQAETAALCAASDMILMWGR